MESINARESQMRDKASVTFYGLPERRNNPHDFADVLYAISIGCVASAGLRLGQQATDPTKTRPRPLKVVFNNTSNRDAVLRAAKNLKGHKKFNNIRRARFLTKNEIEKDREARAQYKQLNNAAGVCASGKKPFIVINGRIMTRTKEGKMRALSTSVSNMSSSVGNGDSSDLTISISSDDVDCAQQAPHDDTTCSPKNGSGRGH